MKLNKPDQKKIEKAKEIGDKVKDVGDNIMSIGCGLIGLAIIIMVIFFLIF